MKTLVNKGEIESDVGLTIVKAFRVANKRAGEAKREAQNENNTDDTRDAAAELFAEWCGKLRDLAAKAEAAGFHIWVNFNGKTGHTYSKDYKPTPDADNDWETYNERMNSQRNAVESLLFPTPDPRNN